MNRHHLAPPSMRVVLVFSLLIAFVVSMEQRAAPPVAQAATPVSISAGSPHLWAEERWQPGGCRRNWWKRASGSASPTWSDYSPTCCG